MTIKQIRKYKILGVAGFDMIGSFVVASLVGRQFGQDELLSGLLSIPIGIFSHMLVGTETPLTKFATEGGVHRYHAMGIGAGSYFASKYGLGFNDVVSANIGLTCAITSALYMAEFGHRNPFDLTFSDFFDVEEDPTEDASAS